MPANKTFGAQGTFIYQMNGHLSQSMHLWLPIEFDKEGTPVIRWVDKPSS